MQKDIEGIPHEFDPDRGAWFPLPTQESLDAQASVYGPAESTEPAPTRKQITQKRKAEMAAAAAAAAHDPSKPRNTAVYVQGLHPDTPLHLISQHFAKCGVILVNADGSDRVKRYTDAQDMPTGDALVIYHKPESVEMVHVACLILILLHQACMILDESLLDGATIRVSPAVFSKPAPGPDNTLPAAKKQRVREKMRDKLAWTADEPDDSTGKSKTVILKHMFTLAALDADPGEMLDLAQDVREECEKRCGPVNRVIVYDGEADGVVAVRFKKCPAAEACVKLMHGRWFDKRRVEARLAVGREKFKKSIRDEAAEDDGVHVNVEEYDSMDEDEQQQEEDEGDIDE
ncbi:MAG: hypothetical protein SGCHY_000432 [Lobulomycetales sp.]